MGGPSRGLDVAVVGAGLAGASCARVLARAGHRPVVFDKGRGPGGRLSVRRAETPLGPARIDHGAQYVTARGRSFEAHLRAAAREGLAALWQARLVSIDRGGNAVDLKGEYRWVGVPGMSAIVEAALGVLDVRSGRRILRLAGGPGAWHLDFEEGGREGPFHRVALTLPPEQLVDLLARSEGDFPEMILEARAAELAPCWAVMGVVEAPFDPGFDAARLLGGGVRWIARMNSRPGRAGPEAFVLHASPDWSRAHLEETPDPVERALWEEMYIRFGLPRPVWRKAHRWRYALSERAPGSPFALDETGTVGCAGDWRLGPRAEFAWDSGEALGEALGRE
ncbi:FAD-dependent oxidoreductase [Marinicauda algicola]|uniref:FAD-dependent oxidoreductase n=1 Tax=Marinicauda algicola TaxID=2029849 RepID=A0A4S2GYZ3_9PROT|nr:NAD(P)-binding protein [Marinicauda algicola]TGY88151.1 FAD-dependent oxidoreductase [Marinicauda algicola]